MSPGIAEFMREAVRLSREGLDGKVGGPFGAVIVRAGQIVGRGANQVTCGCDPTAHAEVMAIRAACRHLQTFTLAGCEIYTSCEPCPMCLAAIYWARLDRIYYANSRTDAAAIGFDDEEIYREVAQPLSARTKPIHPVPSAEALAVFQEWPAKLGRVAY